MGIWQIKSKRCKMKTKKFLLLLLALIGVILLSSNTTAAAGATTVIKKSDGTDLTYRNSSEKVLRLTEYTYPTQDFRAVWISTYVGDIASYSNEAQYKAEVTKILDNMVAYGINAMIFHIRIHNDALYDSNLNPIKSYWKNVNFDQFDPLTYIIEESHKRGIEFHAWLNPYRVLSSGLTTDLATFAQNYRNTNPQFPNNPAGNAEMLVKAGDGVYLNPGEPVVRQHIFDTIQEIIDKYDVDAIHFDDYFYNNVADTEDNKTYNKAGYNPKGLNKGDWRREQVNLLMKGIDKLLNDHFKATGKVVQLGISPTGIYLNSASGTNGQQHYSALYCDSVAWIQNEWIDYLLPQTYWGFEHSTAGFAQLSRYWSTVAVGYDVNMYLGHGIYMAPGSGWDNLDEVRNRFLNMEMYDRIDGSCFYKYSYFVGAESSSVEQVRRGLTLLKNDYWAKRVPGSVVRSYADKVPVVDVTNLSFLRVNDNKLKLTWDAVPNVRGYMVYRTLKNETLDTNNINHVYEYIQANEITVDNNTNYEYYVATVNQANVISTPKALGAVIVGDVQGIIDAINGIALPVNLNQENLITTIRNLYNQLSESDKALVTNYQRLVDAENELQTLKGLRTTLQQVINRTSKHVVTDYTFPVAQDPSEGIVTWQFKSPTDVFNLQTGKRLKERLSYTPVTLIATITKDGYTYSEEVVFNFGITGENQIPLFYRNDPSAMTKDETGPYNTTNHIGWAGKTLTIGNNVFFVAEGNYIELTSSNIPSKRWGSCGVLYRNVSGNDISFALGDSDIRTDNNGYGYIIIDATGNVRVSSVDINPNSIITLKANELLYASHYLDGQLTNPIFTPATKIAVGTKVIFTDYDALRNDVNYQAELVINLINALPEGSAIKLTDEAKFIEARNAYEALTAEAKALVTNLNKLVAGEAQIQVLKQEELLQAKESALAALKVFEDNLGLYSPANQVVINNHLEVGRLAIQNATTVNDVNAALTTYRSLLQQVLTLEEEQLIESKNQAVVELENYVDLNDYSETNKIMITTYISNAKNALQNATTVAEVNSIVSQTKSLIDAVMTLAEENEILNNAKQAALNELKVYEDNLDLYSSANQEQINNLLSAARTAIQNATTTTDVNNILTTYLNNLSKIKTLEEELAELNAQKQTAINQLQNYVNLDHYSEANRTTVQGIINNGVVAINNATSKADIDQALAEAKALIDEVDNLWDEAIEEVENYADPDLYSEADQATLTTLINTAINSIRNARTVSEINQAVSSFKAAVDELVPLYVARREEAKNELDNYVNLDEYSPSNAKKIQDIIAQAKDDIDETTDLDEIDQIVASAKAKIDKISKGAPAVNCQFGVGFFYYIVSVLGVLFVVLRKRH